MEQFASESPKEALDSLESINYDLLSNTDKHYYDFLSVKVADKAYVTHTSDSLILRVIDFESKNKENGRYPEALYYGGRVYHDMGNLPTALNYYQNALDLISEDKTRISLKGRILSQMAGVLNSLRLYNQAIPYAYEVIALDSIQNDSINWIYALELSGYINIHAKNYDSAERQLYRAKQMAKSLSSTDTILHNSYLAAIKYYKNQIDSALELIRPTLKVSNSPSRNISLAYACYIYRDACIPDTSLMYAMELINSKDPLNRRIGYKIAMAGYSTDYWDQTLN